MSDAYFEANAIKPKPGTVNHIAPGERASGATDSDRLAEIGIDVPKLLRALMPAPGPLPVPLKRHPSDVFYVVMPNGKSAKAADAIAAGFIVEGTLAAFQLAEIAERRGFQLGD